MYLVNTNILWYNRAMGSDRKVIAENRRARFDYFIDERITCGIVLEGTEVKSVKNGSISFNDAFAEVINNEVFVRGLHISEYSYSSIFNHNPDRQKKLLLKKDEIKRLKRKVDQKGYTLIPLDFFIQKGLVKVTLGVCRGKKEFDKRATIRERDLKIETQRAFRAANNK